jgi:DNA (cytosine-5)-methyltransferase 1
VSRSGHRLTCIDLFAGCGGLSLGLHWAGFQSVLAVEKSEMAAETYYHNLIRRLPLEGGSVWKEYCGRSVPDQVRDGLFVGRIEVLIDHHLEAVRAAVSKRAPNGVDLIAGGPPCQGFSTAGKRRAGDSRNEMPWRFLRFVDVFEPKLVVIENVAGFQHRFARDGKEAVASRVQEALARTGTGYETNMLTLNAVHYGVPQNRPRSIIVGVRQDLARQIDLKGDSRRWTSTWREETTETAVPQMAPDSIPEMDRKTVYDALADLDSTGYRTGHHSTVAYAHLMRAEARIPAHVEECKPSGLSNHVLRKHSDRVAMRFRLYQLLRGVGLPERLLNVVGDGGPQARQHVLEAVLKLPARAFPVRSPDRKVVAKSREDLASLIFGSGTKKHSQRALDNQEPSPTVMTLPDDLVHPIEARTLTVREMARLQSFPDCFEFRGKETTGGHRRRDEVPQYTQVGNAVPPLLAAAIGRRLAKVLERTICESRQTRRHASGTRR